MDDEFRVSRAELLEAIRKAAPDPVVADLRWDAHDTDHSGDPIIRAWVIYEDASFSAAVKGKVGGGWISVTQPATRAACAQFLRWVPSRPPHVGIRTAGEQRKIDADPQYQKHDEEWLEPDADVIRDARIEALEERVRELESMLRLHRDCDH